MKDTSVLYTTMSVHNYVIYNCVCTQICHIQLCVYTTMLYATLCTQLCIFMYNNVHTQSCRFVYMIMTYRDF